MDTRLAAAALGMLVAFVGCHRPPTVSRSPHPATMLASGPSVPRGKRRRRARLRECRAPRRARGSVRYRVDVHNAGNEAFVRLDRFELVDDGGMTVAARTTRWSARSGRDRRGPLAGDVWVKKRDAERVKSFAVRRFAAALDDDGRAQYRAWLLQGRPGDEATVDQEIARHAAAKPCAGERPGGMTRTSAGLLALSADAERSLRCSSCIRADRTSRGRISARGRSRRARPTTAKSFSPSPIASSPKRPASRCRDRRTRSVRFVRRAARSCTRGPSAATPIRARSAATRSRSRGRRAAAGWRGSPRSTAPRGSTSRRRGDGSISAQAAFLDALVAALG